MVSAPSRTAALRRRLPPEEDGERAERRDVDPEDLDRAFAALAATGRAFGAYAQVARALRGAVEGRDGASRSDTAPPVRVLDVGAGRGDLLAHVAACTGAAGVPARVVGGDPHPVALDLARRHLPGKLPAKAPPPLLLRLEGSHLPLAADAVDFAVSTITLHHLADEAAVAFLREIDRVARRGWIVVDLRRGRRTLAGVGLLAATVWRQNPLPRHDGPVSVKRAFTVPEARRLLAVGGVRDATVTGGPPFQLTLRGGELADPAAR